VSDSEAGRSAWTRAQAKLNLRLHVLAREVSGYHSIETIFHRVELGDDVKVTLAPPGTRSVLTTVDVGAPEQNLAYRAAVLYCEMREWPTGFHIEIGKRIPAGGGMGGGSADAAATLRLMDALAPEPLSPNGRGELDALARSLGADVPFLFSGAPMALAWGHGDRMLLLPPLPQRNVALLFPPFTTSTVEAYRRVSESLGPSAARHEAPGDASLRSLKLNDLSHWSDHIAGHPIAWVESNDFGVAELQEHGGEINNAMHALTEAGAEFGGMTGSGSTLFGIFDRPPDVATLERATGFRVELTRTADAVEPVHLND
jgi:4-diphosphocytidyl-2-C-methyl-D-erythritol kinase